MFNTLFQLISKSILNVAPMSHFANVITALEEVISLIGPSYVKDGNARDAAIDAIIEILQEHKTKK
jgi:hypothetical protein